MAFPTSTQAAVLGCSDTKTCPPPDPKPCFNPEPAYIKDAFGNYVLDASGQKVENLTDNYITDDKGDPPGPEGVTDPTALKFTFVYSGPVGFYPGQPLSGTAALTKTIKFTADFSKLQAIFGAPNSDYWEGKYQSPQNTQANLLAMKNPELIKHQGPIGKIDPTAVTNDVRQKYVKYVDEKPELAESKTQFSDFNGQNLKNINELVTTYGLPNPPGPSDDRTSWLNTWGKYWENIPTTYNEFYIGKLEFRPVHGTAKIQAMKRGDPGACFPNNTLRTVEFPVPNFFRSAATSGVLNQVLLPKSAWSDQNDLMGIHGAVLGIKTSASNFIESCFKFASNNPVTNVVKKVLKVSMQKLEEQYSVYAAWSINNVSVSGTSATITFSPAANGNFGLVAKNNDTGQVFDSGAISSGRTSWTFNNLTPGNYRAVLIFGFSEISNSVNFNIAAPPPVGATNLSTSNEACTGGQVNITFNWTPQPNNVWWSTGAQWLDLSTNAADPFGPGNFINHDVFGQNSYSTTTAPGNIGPLVPNTTHYWRINTQNALNGAWAPSATGQFTTINCVAPPVTTWTLNTPTIANRIAHFTFSPAANGNFALIITRPDGTVAKDSGAIASGQTSWDWAYTEAGDFNAVLVAFGVKEVSNKVSFKIWWHITDPPLITRNANNTVSVKFDFWPPANGNFPLIITNDGDGSVGFNSGNIPSGATTVTWNDARWGDWTAKLVYILTQVSDNAVKFHIAYILNQPVVAGRNVTFTWSPPLHIGTGMAIIVRKTDPTKSLVWDSGSLPINSTQTIWSKASPGDYEACLLYLGTVELDAHGLVCKTFSVSFAYNWTVFDLSENSCIKVGKQGKAGNAPFCAIYPTKFEPGHTTEPNILPVDSCTAGTNTLLKLNNDSNNVVCTFTFTWKSSDYDLDPNKNLTVPATGNGNWDECDPASGGFRTCYLTVGVWPDFRVPYLGQIWNNSLFSDTNEYLPTKQVTGQPGVYALLQPKAVAEELAKDPIQVMIDKCEADPTRSITGGCKDLVDWGATHSTAYPGFGDCVGAALLDPTHAGLIACFDLVAHSIIGKNLPGEVNSNVLGVNTGTGSVLGASDNNQKERLIGAVDCNKHFSRDIALKPKALQESLGIQQDCTLTASALPPGSAPPGPTPPPSPPASPLPPSGNTCPLTRDPPNGYVLDNPLGLNFGDPNCDFSQSKLYDELKTIDPTYADYWFFTIASCETTNYNPNAYNPASTSGSAWGLFQMGHQAYPALGIDVQMNNEFDRGDVIWQTQTSNAVNYNRIIGNSFDYWGCKK